MKFFTFPLVVILLCGCNVSRDKYDVATDQVKRNSPENHRSLDNNKERTVKMHNGGGFTLKEDKKAPIGFMTAGPGDAKTEIKLTEPLKK